MVRVLSLVLLSSYLGGAKPPVAPLDAARHPIHSTLTAISFDPAARLATLRVRAFADDFGAAIARWTHSRPVRPGMQAPAQDSLTFEYLTQMISLERAPGQVIPLEWCGVERTGAVLWFCLRGHLDHGLQGVRVADRMLNDLFADEINIVQMEEGTRHTSAVFTRRDAARVLIAKAAP